MPHVTVSLWPGKSLQEKRQLSDAIVASIIGVLGYGEGYISVGFKEVAAADWMTSVYEPEIAGRWETLTKKPGYGPRPAD